MSRQREPGVLRLVVVAAAALALLVGGWWLVSGRPVVATPPQGVASGSATTGASSTGRGTATVPATPGTAGSASARTGSTGSTRAGGVDPASGLRWVSLAELPPEASETVAEIEAGPPFPTRKDGAVFGNFEGLLPKRASGYYREFTVPTPGESDRGARRIVTGGPDYGTANAEFYYTADHYASFERIRP